MRARRRIEGTIERMTQLNADLLQSLADAAFLREFRTEVALARNFEF